MQFNHLELGYWLKVSTISARVATALSLRIIVLAGQSNLIAT